MERKRDIYLYLNVAASLNDLLNLFARQPLLPLVARILKENKSKKVAALQVTKGTRDLTGRLLYLSATTDIDLESVFSFPILPEPF